MTARHPDISADQEGYAPDESGPAYSQAEIVAAAQQERHDLIAAEVAHHVSNARSELKRHEDALAHIEHVYRLRTGQPEPGP